MVTENFLSAKRLYNNVPIQIVSGVAQAENQYLLFHLQKRAKISLLQIIIFFAFITGFSKQCLGQGSVTFSKSGSFVVPANITSVTVQVWGGGGKGGTRTTNGTGGGGGGGAYSSGVISVTPGNSYNVVVGTGSTTTFPGGDSWFYSTSTILAKGGNSVANNSAAGAAGGLASSGVGITKYSGGAGATGSGKNAGGGGSSAGTGANGVDGGVPKGGVAPPGGGNGGDGKSSKQGDGNSGKAPGGGGGGAYRTFTGTRNGGNGADGKVIISWTCPAATISYDGTPFCNSEASPQNVTITGSSGGTFSSTEGLTLNPSNGAITPGTSNIGIYTVTYMIDAAGSCGSVSTNTSVTISPSPSAPVAGTITQPTCTKSSGEVALFGLPSIGTWTLTRNPGGVKISGTESSTTISLLPSGIYTFTVTDSTGCASLPSESVLINAQPPTPESPSVGIITSPTCELATGSVILSGLPSSGIWTLIQYPGTISTTGTGISITITGLVPGTYNYTVTTADGCLSNPSANVVIPVQPSIPSTPIIGNITQPTFDVPTGSIVLSGLPSTGTWKIIRFPGGATASGTGINTTITGLAPGVFTFTVTNSSGCTSLESNKVVISTPNPPVLLISDPDAVCSPATADITSSAITAGSTPGLTYTYWIDAEATVPFNTPAAATAGIYYIKGIAVSGYFDIKRVIVTVDQMPLPDAGIDQTLEYQFSTRLDATLDNNETGEWSLISGTGIFSDSTDEKATVRDLSLGINILRWTVKNGVCPAISDSVEITIHNFVIPTMITPNNDGRNDFFTIRVLSNLGKTELWVFDRRGTVVYKNMNYDNNWNGIDYNKLPLPDDTYFFVLKPQKAKPVSGYVKIRR